MKAILEFDLPEERDEHKRAVLADDMCSVLWVMHYEELRTKHKDLTEQEEAVYDKLSERLIELLYEHGINLDDIYK